MPVSQRQSSLVIQAAQASNIAGSFPYEDEDGALTRPVQGEQGWAPSERPGITGSRYQHGASCVASPEPVRQAGSGKLAHLQGPSGPSCPAGEMPPLGGGGHDIRIPNSAVLGSTLLFRGRLGCKDQTPCSHRPAALFPPRIGSGVRGGVMLGPVGG